MMNKLKRTYSGLRAVVKHEGVRSLIKRGLVFLLHWLFVFEDYYVVVVEHKDVDKEVEADYLPNVDDHSWRILTTNQEVDELIADSFELGAYELNLRIFLSKGAVASCHFVDKELAHYTFWADNPRGKEAVDPLPYNVDFKNGQTVVVGRSLTVPKYRRLHFRKYNGHMNRKYFWARGIICATYSLQKSNYPALFAAAQPPDKLVVSRCRFIKILGFKYMKEIKMEPTPLKQIVAQISKRLQTKNKEQRKK